MEKTVREIQREDADEIAKEECQFYMEKDGKYYKCKKNAFGISRGKSLCLTHYNLIKRDNKKRLSKGLQINSDISLLINNPPVSRNLCTIEIEKPKDKIVEVEEEESSEPLSYVEGEEI